MNDNQTVTFAEQFKSTYSKVVDFNVSYFIPVGVIHATDDQKMEFRIIFLDGSCVNAVMPVATYISSSQWSAKAYITKMVFLSYVL